MSPPSDERSLIFSNSPEVAVHLQKSLPHSLEAERAVLGAILLENSVFDQAAEILTESDFYLEGHQKIFSKMVALASVSKAMDLLMLREVLERDNQLESVGGVAYVASLLDGVPRLSNIDHYARIVKEKSLLRKLIHSANEIVVRSFSDEEEPLTLLEQAEKAIFEISQEKIQGGFVSLSELLPDTYKHMQSLHELKDVVTGISTGFIDLDRLTSGLQCSDLIILAARPGLGKTSLALNIAQHAAVEEKKVVGVFSLEMAAQQLVIRLLCAQARIDGHKLRSGYLSKEDWQRVAGGMSKLSQALIYLDDSAGLSIIEMRSKARRLKAEKGLDLLIVDYLQLMGGSSGSRVRYENRQQEISAISRSLKGLAKELDVPVIALSQLSRAPEQRRGDHRPQLSDLRESGSIEQDADVVLFIYREDLYKKTEDVGDEEGVAQIIIGKQRNGPTGVIKLVFIEPWTKFENLAREI